VSRKAIYLLAFAMVALMAIVAISLQRELGFGSASTPVLAIVQPEPPAPPPLTPEEEAFAEALWPLHQGVVEASAGRLSSAGIAFAIDDHDAHRLAAKLKPLRAVFHDAREKVVAIAAPPSLQGVHDRYVTVLSLYEQSAAEMLEVERDGDEGHLINAQIKSGHAAEELVKVGDILWPGEHKPN
jgi:hypothetical protein